MAARVTQKEKEKMWELYQEGKTFVAIGKKLGRCADTVSRYVHEHEAAVNAVRVVMDARTEKK